MTQINSRTGNKSKQKETEDEKSMTLNQLNHMLYNYKNESLSHANLHEISNDGYPKELDLKNTANSVNQQKKKSQSKLNVIYKQLLEKVKVLQMASQTLYEKSQKYKEYKTKTEHELAEREQRIAFLENRYKVGQKSNQDLISHQAFNYNEDSDDNAEMEQDKAEIIKQLRNIDTTKAFSRFEMLDSINHSKSKY